MKLADIINKSAYCSIGCITKSQDIEILEQYILYNKPVISSFSKIIVAHTKLDSVSNEDFEKYNNVWVKFFENKVVLIKRPNFGHTFGFTDLDKTVMSKTKELGYNWCWKSTNDVLITKNIFNIEMGNGQFFYLQGHGIAGIIGYYKGNVDLAVNSFKESEYEKFFPQTNFFIVSTNTDELIKDEVFDEQYCKCLNDPEYNTNRGQIEYKYLMSEGVLRDFVYRNKLQCKHLINKDSYRKLIQVILHYNIADSSHKNVFFNECGVCHFHFLNQPVIEI